MFNTKEAELYKRITELEKDLAVEKLYKRNFVHIAKKNKNFS